MLSSRCFSSSLALALVLKTHSPARLDDALPGITPLGFHADLNPVVPFVVYPMVWREQQVQVLDGLGQEEGLHPILDLVSQHVADGRVAARRPRAVPYGREDLDAHLEQKRVLRGAVKVHDRLDQFRAQRVTVSRPAHLLLKAKNHGKENFKTQTFRLMVTSNLNSQFFGGRWCAT